MSHTPRYSTPRRPILPWEYIPVDAVSWKWMFELVSTDYGSRASHYVVYYSL